MDCHWVLQAGRRYISQQLRLGCPPTKSHCKNTGIKLWENLNNCTNSDCNWPTRWHSVHRRRAGDGYAADTGVTLRTRWHPSLLFTLWDSPHLPSFYVFTFYLLRLKSKRLLYLWIDKKVYKEAAAMAGIRYGNTEEDDKNIVTLVTSDLVLLTVTRMY